MTEWELQRVLTKHWWLHEVDHGAERLMLVAWEVMFPKWTINDAAHEWNKPSIDFLAMDRNGCLVAIELKLRVLNRKPAWEVLSQVSHRAICVGRTVTPERLQQAHDLCASPSDGRVSAGPSRPIWQRHREFFTLAAPLTTIPGGVRRIVAATRFGDQYETIECEFNSDPPERTLEHLQRDYKTSKEFDRLASVLPLCDGELSAPCEHLEIKMDELGL